MKTIIITGGSDGIGAAAAKQLKSLGHNVIIVGRTRDKTEKLARTLDVPFHIADFSSLDSVRNLAEELRRYEKIDVLANNAGGVMKDITLTNDGIEKTFQVNVIGGFLLTHLLMDKLIESKATVIQTTSIAANLFADLNINDLNSNRGISPVIAYGNSKLCNILFTRELHKRFNSRGIHSVAFEPGIVRSNFASEGFFKPFFHSFLKYLFTISPEKSAKRLVRLATESSVSGEIYSYKRKMKVFFKDKDGQIAHIFWDKCEEMIR